MRWSPVAVVLSALLVGAPALAGTPDREDLEGVWENPTLGDMKLRTKKSRMVAKGPAACVLEDGMLGRGAAEPAFAARSKGSPQPLQSQQSQQSGREARLH